MSFEKRPSLTLSLKSKDFVEYYWLKEELHAFCKEQKLPTSGSKAALTLRIAHFLETGLILKSKRIKATKSTFDWSKEVLSTQTIITDNYQNSQNVRRFFEKKIGPSFKFSVLFMNWMKFNTGKNLGDAITAWREIKLAKKGAKTSIAPQFEYNQYFRDFFEANPDRSRKDARALWNIVKERKGDRVYMDSDLRFLPKF